MTVQLTEAAVVLMMASIVQTSAGFGVGVVAVPLLLWLGWDLPVAIPAVLGAALGQGAFGLWKTRGHIALKESVFVAFFQWLGMPLGLLTMRVLLWEHPLLTRQAAGGLVLLLVVTSQFFRPEKVAKLRASAGALAGGAAGYLSGLIGMGGPPLVFFAMAHDWPVSKFRSFLRTQLILGAPVLIALLAYSAGDAVWRGLAIGIVCMPTIWLGSLIGFRITRSWKRAQLDRVTNLLLLLIGTTAVVLPFLFR